MGASGSTTLCYILPGLFYHKLTSAGYTSPGVAQLPLLGPNPWNINVRGKVYSFKRVLAAFLATTGVLLMVVSVTVILTPPDDVLPTAIH